MSFVKNILTGLVRYGDFAGRSSRSEYRDFRLFAFLPVGLDIIFIESHEVVQIAPALGFFVGWTLIICWIALVLPAMAATVRRFHDLDMSGWWTVVPNGLIFWAVLSYYGYAWVQDPGALLNARLAGVAYLCAILFLMLKKGTAKENRFGLDPLTSTSEHPALDLPGTE